MTPSEDLETPPLVVRGPEWVGRALRFVWRHPWLGALAAGTAGYAIDPRDFGLSPVDYPVFVTAGESLLQGDLASVFSDPLVQSGPLTLAAFAGLDGAARELGLTAVLPFLAMSLTASFCMTAAIRSCSQKASNTWAGAGLLAAWVLALGWGGFTGVWAHPTHFVVPLLWTLSVLMLQNGTPMRAGATLGLAVAFDSWAVLGFCALVIVLPDLRSMARGAASAIGVGLVAWLPFLIAGPLRSGEMTWPTEAGTIPDLLGDAHIDVAYRLVQAGIVLAVGGLVAWRLRGETDLAWLLPVVVISTRVFLDGVFFEYYALPVLVGLLTGLAVTLGRRDRRALLLAPAALLASVSLPVGVGLVAHMPLYAGVVLALIAVSRPRRELELPAVALRAGG